MTHFFAGFTPRFLAPRLMTRPGLLLLGSLLLSACTLGPDYQRPDTPTPTEFMSAGQWVVATPGDALERGTWWQLFADPQLDKLEASIEISNQNVAAAQASYEQARALVASQRAAIFPSVDLTAGANRGNSAATRTVDNKYQVGIGASWEPDVWGRLRRATSGARAAAQASAADLAAAKLSAQGELAINYFSLRQTDAQYQLLKSTVETYQRSQEIARNRYNAGVTTKSDVLQAETQLASAQADLLDVERDRAQYQNAIAVLVGKLPEDFTLAPMPEWQATVPGIPLGVPSELLQRRPDIAAAERRVASANEQIGIAKAGYFPSLQLSASDGNTTSDSSNLLNSNINVWSVGASLAQTLFDAGATRARVNSAKAAHQEATARYRQTVLAAFADVENQLTAIRILSQQQVLRKQANEAADQVEQQAINRYRQGQISYTDVVSAQTSALSARRAMVQALADSQTAAVALIQALGGGWQSNF